MPNNYPTYPSKWCGCGHAKRTHQHGWYLCRAKGCACTKYARNDARWDADYAAYKVARDAYYAELRNRQPSPDPSPARLPDDAATLRGMGAGRACDVHRFPSYSALLKAAAQPPVCDDNKAGWERYNLTGRKDAWALGDDYGGDDAKLATVGAWLLRGWAGGVSRMRDALGQVTLPHLADVRRHGRWADVGDVLSHDRLYSGDERCWRTTHKARTGAPPRLQIMVNGATSSMVRTSDMFWKGAAGLALAEAATRAGYTVAIDLIQATHGYTYSGADYIHVTRCKDYDAPLNVASLAALTAHPSTLRIVTFALCYATAWDRVDGGLGSPRQPSEQELRDRGCVDSNAMLLTVPQGCFTPEAAKAWVAEQVARLASLAQEGGNP